MITCLLFIILLQPMYLYPKAGSQIASLLQIHAANADLGKNFGKNIGLGTLMFLSDKLAAAGSAIAITAKTGAITVISAPATPYIVVGISIAGTGYATYKIYHYYHSETRQIVATNQEKIKCYNVQIEAEEAETKLYNAKMKTLETKQSLAQKLAASTVAST